MSYERAKELFTKYKNEMATDEEKALVEKWLFGYNNEPSELSDEKIESISREVWSRLPRPILSPIHRLTVWPRIAAAASIILALSAGGYIILHQKHAKPETAQFIKNDIAPGHNQATLTLSGGKKIILKKGLSGTLATQGQTIIDVTRNDITYHSDKTGDQVSYNTLTTALGEQSPYPLVLADGTKVWLNAESSITFPTAFNQKDRIVKITGEALFEVAHNANKPFKVLTDKQIIEDIGTQFDVNAYSDEPARKTTLLEGAVRVIDNGSQTVVLKPGEQSVLTGNNLKVEQANILKAVAWKNGEFRFSDDNIETIMRQLARWYNIDVSYEGAITKEVFYAKLSRQRNISAVLKVLERTKGIHFKVEGRRVTVIQ
jgi:transmembrane sensor